SLVDFLLVCRSKRWCVLTGGQGTALAGEVVAGCTVHTEQFATTGNVLRLNLTVVVGPTKFFHRNGAVFVVHNVTSAPVGCYICVKRMSVRLSVASSFALSLCVIRHHRYTTGVDVEVYGARTIVQLRRAPVFDTLMFCTVASNTRNVVDVIA